MKKFLKELEIYIKSEYYNLKKHHKIKLITLILLIIFFPLTIPLSIIGFIIGIFIEFNSGRIEYNKSFYKSITKTSYFNCLFNKGKLAEYLTFKILSEEPEYKKVLINLYIPNGEETSEIDAILLNEYGIFVIESKGFSGWIFGSDKNNEWKQVIYNRGNYFYSPIAQNSTHIKVLNRFLKIEDLNIFRSYIVFSERCELKKIILNNKNTKVIKRHQLKDTLNNDYKIYGKVLTEEEIDSIYNKLYKYMFVDDEVKIRHINHITKLKEKEKKIK